MNGMVLAVNSTAVVSDVQLSYNGTVLRCSEYADLSMFRETVLKVAGEELAYNYEASLLSSAHAPKAYGSRFVCQSFCHSVCL